MKINEQRSASETIARMKASQPVLNAVVSFYDDPNRKAKPESWPA